MEKTIKEHVLIVTNNAVRLASLIAMVLLISVLVWFGNHVNERIWDHFDALVIEHEELLLTAVALQNDLDRYRSQAFIVDLTIYHNKVEQTDSTPLITADGTVIPITEVYHVGTRRICAISRDLHKRFGGDIDFGDYIYIGEHVRKTKYVKDPDTGKTVARIVMVAGPFTGFWRVSDIMGTSATWVDVNGIPRAKPILNTIDLLMDINHKNAKFTNVEARLFPQEVFIDQLTKS